MRSYASGSRCTSAGKSSMRSVGRCSGILLRPCRVGFGRSPRPPLPFLPSRPSSGCASVSASVASRNASCVCDGSTASDVPCGQPERLGGLLCELPKKRGHRASLAADFSRHRALRRWRASQRRTSPANSHGRVLLARGSACPAGLLRAQSMCLQGMSGEGPPGVVKPPLGGAASRTLPHGRQAGARPPRRAPLPSSWRPNGVSSGHCG